MNDDVVRRVESNPKYRHLVQTRSKFSILMTFCVLLVYYGYILLIAFNKEWLGSKLAQGMTTSVGIPLGLGVIVVTIILTNIYVRRANTEFDAITAEIVKEARGK